MWYNHIKELSYPYARTKDIKSSTTLSSETSANCQCHVNIASHKWAMDSRQPLPHSVRSSTCWGRLSLSCLLQTLHMRNCSHSECTLRRVWVIGSSLSPFVACMVEKLQFHVRPLVYFADALGSWECRGMHDSALPQWQCTPTIQECTRA